MQVSRTRLQLSAEIMGQRRDEADHAPGLRALGVAGRAPAAVGDVGQIPVPLQPRAHLVERQILVDAVLGAHIPHRHHLDEGEVIAALAAPADELRELVLIGAAQRNAIDLDRETGPPRGLQSVEHLRHPSPAGDLCEFFCVECVEGDIDAPDAEFGEAVREAGELRTVGGEGQLVEIRAEMPGEALDQPDHIAPHQRLAAGQAQFAHAEPDEGRAEPIELLQGEEFLLGKKLHVLRHAIDAAEVASVSDRYAEIRNGTLERIDQRGRARCMHV